MSFASMHNDYLDPDRHLWPDEGPDDWDGDSYMRCYRCDEDGPAQHFRIPTN